MPRPAHDRPSPTSRCPLTVEQLEERSLPSATDPSAVLDLSGLRVSPNSYDPSHILVRFRSGVAPVALPGTAIGTELDLVAGLYDVQLASGVTVEQALAAYRADRGALSADPDALLSVASIPNNPQFSSQYALQNTGQSGGTPGADIHATQAWNITTGNNNVVIAVMDSGADYDHPDLYQNIWINQAEIPPSRRANLIDVDGDGIITFKDLNDPRNQGPFKITDINHDGRIDASDILAPMIKDAQGRDTGLGGWVDGVAWDGDTAHPNDLVGWNFVNNTNMPADDNGHGTIVSGVIGAQGNSGEGVAGVDWQAQLMIVKFIGANGSGTVSNFIAGLNYAVAHGAKISNNSWGSAAGYPLLADAINNARQAGQIFVVAAGNGASNLDNTAYYPASYELDNMVSVAATDRNDNLASFSNYGAHSVSLAAPGVSIVSTYPGKSYTTDTGTSLAAPFVTGVLALVWEQHPNWTYRQVIDQVLHTVDPLPSLHGKTIAGGRLDAAAALGASPASPPPAPAPPPADMTHPSIIANALTGAANTISTVRVTFDKPVDPGSFKPSVLQLTGPNGQPIAAQQITAVAGTNNTQFNILFPTQTAAGAYSLRIGPEVFDLSWNKMNVFQTAYVLGPPAGPTHPSIIANALIGAPNTISTVRVTFDKTIDPGSFKPSVLQLTGPNGRTITAQQITAVAGTNNTQFNVVFPTQTAAGTYNLRIGPEVFDLYWNKMNVFQTAYVLSPPTHPSIIANALIGAANTLSTVRVTFDKPIDPGSFKPSVLQFTGPNGQLIAAQQITAVAGTNNTQFNIVFPTQTAAGTYNLRIGPEVFDLNWNKMNVFLTSYVLGPAHAASASTTDLHTTSLSTTRALDRIFRDNAGEPSPSYYLE